jgi:thiamine pyrophosphate-dependent acetolactate synthase large subunit-like protein
MTAAEWLIDDLRERGVVWMATLCGHGLDPLFQAARNAGMRLIDTRNEQTASYIAESWGRLTGRPGVCAVSSGIAQVNALTGAANAWFDCAPMLLISGSAATTTAGMGHFQDLDQVTLARPITKFSRSIDCASRVREILADALGIAAADPRGPVHLLFPMDIQNTEVPESALVSPAALSPRRAAVGADVDEAAHALGASEKPLVIAGSGIFYDHEGPEMLRFCEQCRVPVVTPIWDRGSVDQPSPVFLGVIGAATGGPPYLSEADCIVMAGAEVDYRLGYLRPPAVRSDARFLSFRGRWDELAASCRRQNVKAPEAWLASCVGRRDEFRRSVEDRVPETTGGTMHAVHIIRAIQDILAELLAHLWQKRRGRLGNRRGDCGAAGLPATASNPFVWRWRVHIQHRRSRISGEAEAAVRGYCRRRSGMGHHALRSRPAVRRPNRQFPGTDCLRPADRFARVPRGSRGDAGAACARAASGDEIARAYRDPCAY